MQTKDSMDMLSSKMDKLKLQAEKLSQILSGKLNELGVECFQALSSGTKNAHPMVAFKLNIAAEFIHTLFSKVEDFCQLSKEDVGEIQTGSVCQQPGMKASLLELAERFEVLEKSVLSGQPGGDDKKGKEVEAKFDNLASDSSQRMKGFEILLYDVMSDVATVKQTLTSVSADVTICTKKDEENERRMEKFDEDVKDLKDCKERIKSLQSDVDGVERHMEDLASVSSEIKDCNEKIKSLQSDVDRVERHIEDLGSVSSDIKDCNERIKSLQSDVDGVERDVKDLASVPIKIDQSSSRIDKLEAKLSCIEHVVEDLDSISTTVGDCKITVDKLQSKVCCVENAVENVDRGNKKMKDQLKKVSANQTRLKKILVEKDDLNKQVYHLLSKKVYMLETLQDVLCEIKLRADTKGKSMEDTVTATQSQVLELKDSYDRLSTQIATVSRAPVGFRACLMTSNTGTQVMANSNVGGILRTSCNRGNCYIEQEGHFVVPHDGLYCFYARVEQRHNVKFSLHIKVEKGQSQTELLIPVYDKSQRSAVCVCDLPSNTRVYLTVEDSDGGEALTLDLLLFCGWSIGYH